MVLALRVLVKRKNKKKDGFHVLLLCETYFVLRLCDSVVTNKMFLSLVVDVWMCLMVYGYRMNVSYGKVYTFWCTHGEMLQTQKEMSLIQSELVLGMSELHQDILGLMGHVNLSDELDRARLQKLKGNIGGILRYQAMHIVQFACCLDEFNRNYLSPLRLIESVLCLDPG